MEVTGLLMALALGTLLPCQDPEPGIARTLAEQRVARLSDLRYELRFELRRHAVETEGHVTLQFTLAADPPLRDLVLDFGGHGVADVKLNGAKLELRSVHDHLILPVQRLAPGRNTFSAAFRSAIAPSGTPLTVYRDASDGQEYLYTLLVPADAHRLFPCFDQPDLKARFALRLRLPKDWVAIANAAEKHPARALDGERKEVVFADTLPLCTYLMAFAAGPFAVLADHAPEVPLRLVVRRSRRAALEHRLLFRMHHRALGWCGSWFGIPYPFGKLDLVLIPGFPYGGMEHAGAIFYSEPALVFDHAPTASERTRRITLIDHEISHQWFGNLVSFVWFDDLWLKEGFATFIAYRLLEALEPKRNAWLRFQQRVEPAAYRIDSTLGTTPIWQKLSNLDDAKSAYGGIVYSKAPAVLRELESRIGRDPFRKALQAFLRRHAFGNARWRDLLAALEKASGEDLSDWSNRWILGSGMPRVRARWEAENGKITAFEVRQERVQGGAGTWPLAFEMLLGMPDGARRRVMVRTDRAVTKVESLIGEEAPAWVLPNADDKAYGQFLPGGTTDLLAAITREPNPMLRSVGMSSLFESVREAELDPARFAEVAIQMLGAEHDPETHAWLLARLDTTLHRYLDAKRRAPLVEQVTGMLGSALQDGMPGRELQSLRFLVRVSNAEDVLKLAGELLDGKSPVPGLTLGPRDRFLMLAALLAAGKADGRAERMTADKSAGDVARWAYEAGAAGADPATKERYFASFVQLEDPPERWVQGSLESFHWPGQGRLTLPWLLPALEKLEWVKRNRKIFFMPAWIDGFVNGHSSREALRVVEAFLAEKTEMPNDIRRKVLQSVDALRRAVKIKDRWK